MSAAHVYGNMPGTRVTRLAPHWVDLEWLDEGGVSHEMTKGEVCVCVHVHNACVCVLYVCVCVRERERERERDREERERHRREGERKKAVELTE